MAEEEKKQPFDEQELKSKFDSALEISKRFMDPIHMQMDRHYEMYRNRWKDSGEFRISKFFAYVETVVPFMINNRVRGTVKAEFPEYTKHSEGMKYILDHTFDVNNWDYMAQRIAKMAEIYRMSLAYTGWDGEAKNGAGQLCITEVNPRWCYIDPAVTELQDSSIFIYVEPMRASKAIKKHPDKAKEIKKSMSNRNNPNNTNQGTARKWFQTFLQRVQNFLNVNFESNQAQDISNGFNNMMELAEDEKRKDSVAYIHFWYRDDEDKWRVSYWADEVFLEDLDNPFWHGKLPYDAYVPCEDILSAVGLPVGEQIENISWELNVLMNEIIRNVKLSNDPPMIRNISAFRMIEESQKLAEPRRGGGSIDVPNPDMVPLNALVQPLIPPQVQGQALNLKQVFDELEDQLLGTSDTMRGMGDATSGKEVQLKQEAAYTRIKTKLDNFEKFVKGMSEKIIVNAMQFIDTNRPFRVKGDYRQYDHINADNTPFEVKPIERGMQTVDQQDGTQTQQPVYDNKEFFLYANPNEWTKIVGEDSQGTDGPQPAGDTQEEQTEEKVQEAFRILQFVVEIEAGSSLPTSRSARREESMELFQAQAVDQQYVLEAYEVPGADEIMRRMGEAAQAAQQAQQQAEQAKADMEMKKMEMEMKLKEMELQSKMDQTQMNNDAKAQTAQLKQQPSQQPQGLAEVLDEIRNKNPEAANMSDEELLAAVGQ